MQQPLESVVLKSGETMTIIKTTAPEPGWTDRIVPFLGHKGELTRAAIRRAYDAGLDDLVMSDFLGVLPDGTVVGNITTVESDGIAILQHVFTPPEHRRKGICTHLLQALCDDFTTRGVRAVFLGTGYDSPPYHIYESFGFRGRGDSGKMTWVIDPTYPHGYFALASATVAETRWEDWPKLEALYALTGHWQLKSYLFQLLGHAGFEGEYPALRHRLEEGSMLQTLVMRTASGAVVGHAMLGVEQTWRGWALVLDLMVAPGFTDPAGEMLRSLRLPQDRKVHAYCDQRAAGKAALLEAVGFEHEGTLRKVMQDESHTPLDVLVYGKLT